MALLIPRLGSARFDTGGEQRLAERLGEKLEENALVWHNVPVGPRGRHPDFLILHPHQGLLVLEVKDWRIDAIVRADKLQVQLLTSRGLVTTVNPGEQARSYMFDVKNLLERWCRRMLVQYGLPVPRREEFADDDALFAAMVSQMIAAVDAGQIPVGQYDAVLIDEAHDFEHAWLQLAARMVNLDTRSLFIVYDNAQSIYGKKKPPVWSHLGIEAQGRTTVMKLNYRNTSEICAFARRFASDILAEPYEDEEGLSTTMLPESSGRRGVEPMVQRRANARDEADAAAQWLLERHRAGYAWRDMVVLAPGKRNWRDPLARAFDRETVPYRMLLGDRQLGPDFVGDHVHVMTLHAVKGLEFPAVAVAGIGDLPWKSQTLEDAARLLYVAMTRATHVLTISYSKPSALVERLLSI